MGGSRGELRGPDPPPWQNVLDPRMIATLLNDVQKCTGFILQILNFYEGLFSSFVKIKSSRNGEIILSFTDISKSCTSRDF